MALPKIAMLLLALELEDVEIASGHCCVADLLSHARDATLSFLNITNRDFARIYCTEHALDSFPKKSSPPLIPNTPTPAPPAQQGGVLAIRGGNGDDDFLRSLESEDERPHEQRALTAIAQLNAGQHTRITPTRARRPEGGQTRVGRPPKPRASFQFTQMSQVAQENFDNFDYGDNTQTEDEVPHAQAQELPPPLEGSDQESEQDELMADGIAEPRRNATPPVVNNVYTQRPAFMSATQVLRRRILLKVHHQLLKVIEEIFINPQAAYLQQDSDNKKALRVRKVVREQAMKTTADKVSEAIQAEGNVDPKLVKILIKDAVEAKFK